MIRSLPRFSARGIARPIAARPVLAALLLGCSFVFSLGCSGPFVMIPGGELDGPTTPVPDDWGFTDEISTIQIETNPADPYSVNIWVAAIGPNLYLHAGGNRTTWVEHLEADPNLRVRVDGKIYELVGARVEDQAEFDSFVSAYESKYNVRPRNETLAEIYVIRLVARKS